MYDKLCLYTLYISTPGQIQYGRFIRTLAKKIGDVIRDRVRVLYLLILCCESRATHRLNSFSRKMTQQSTHFN